MALDKVLIGERIRKVRVEIFNESRKIFAQRCNLPDRYIAQIERGEFLITLNKLDIIASATGISADYFLYGKDSGKKSTTKTRLHELIDRYDEEQAGVVLKCVTTLQSYYFKQFKED